jgi:hypothetical protein
MTPSIPRTTAFRFEGETIDASSPSAMDDPIAVRASSTTGCLETAVRWSRSRRPMDRAGQDHGRPITTVWRLQASGTACGIFFGSPGARSEWRN